MALDGTREHPPSNSLNDVIVTGSDNVLGNLVDRRMMTFECLSALLNAIEIGTFDSKDVTFRRAEDMFIRPVNRRHRTLFNDERVSTAGVPKVVLQSIIDVLSSHMESYQKWRNTFAFDIFEKCDDISFLASFRSARSTLKRMSLVHPSWTLLVHRAIGRTLQVHEIGDASWSACFHNPLYGPWTTDLTFRIRPHASASASDLDRRSFFLEKLHTRFPHLRTVSMTFYHLSAELEAVVAPLLSTLDLEHLVILHEGMPVENTIAPP